MKPKQMMLFAVAIGCGLIAMIGAQQILSGNKPGEQEFVEILVATKDIDPGIPLDKTNVGMRKWPKEQIPEGAINAEEVWVDHSLKIHLAPNMPVLVPYLSAKGAMGVTSLIPEGMTMVTLPVNSAMLASGLLRPGSYVQISCTIDKVQKNQTTPVTQVKTVLKRVKVIAVGTQVAGTEANKDPNAGKGEKVENVSFVTFPNQAKLLFLAQAVSMSRVHFTILPENDKSNDDVRDLDENDLNRRSNELLGGKDTSEYADLLPKAALPVENHEKPRGSSFSEYLKQPAVQPEVADLGKQPARAMWQIKIYKGNKPAEIQEVDLPKDATEAIEPVENNKATSSMEDWTSPLLKFFKPKAGRKAAVQEAQSATTDNESDDAPVEKSAKAPGEPSRN